MLIREFKSKFTELSQVSIKCVLSEDSTVNKRNCYCPHGT